MKTAIFMGSPHPDGNTAELVKPFREELNQMEDVIVQYITIPDKVIGPCRGCHACQQVSGLYGCVQQDDMWELTGQMLWADLIVLAVPIYTSFCPAECKAMLDRLYGMNKYYGSAAADGKHPLLAGRGLAFITTHGYGCGHAAAPFETGMMRFCEHSGLDYYGMYSVSAENGPASFRSEAAKAGARNFAGQLLLDWMNRSEYRIGS